MINKYVAMGLGALIALAPVAAVAQEQVAQAATDSTQHGPSATGHTGRIRRSHRRSHSAVSGAHTARRIDATRPGHSSHATMMRVGYLRTAPKS